jgi:hypothetical protein
LSHFASSKVSSSGQVWNSGTSQTGRISCEASYRVIGSIDAESGNLAIWQSGKTESLRPAVKEAAQHGADAVIVLAQDVETRGYSTATFAQGQSNTNFNASAYGNSIYGNANTNASAWGSAFTTPNRRGKARVLAIKFT